MRVGPQLEATRHLLGELTLTLARQSRHHFPKQGRCPTTSLGCRRSEPLLALSSKPTKLLADRHEQSVCHVSRHDSNKDPYPAKRRGRTKIEHRPGLVSHPRSARCALRAGLAHLERTKIGGSVWVVWELVCVRAPSERSYAARRDASRMSDLTTSPGSSPCSWAILWRAAASSTSSATCTIRLRLLDAAAICASAEPSSTNSSSKSPGRGSTSGLVMTSP